MYIRFYDLNSTFTFGKFKGKTLNEVIEIQPSYIDWCAINLGHFCIAYEDMKKIRKFAPDFRMSKEGQQSIIEKITEWDKDRLDEEENEQNAKMESDKADYDDGIRSKYNGAYGYSDDAIDSAFEGDPENYWNID